MREPQIGTKLECDKCGLEAVGKAAHVGRKHKVCGGKRTIVPVLVPSMAWTYGKVKKSPLFGFEKDGVTAIRYVRASLRGDRSEHGTWRTA